MRKQSKARNKAFQAAAEHMKEQQGWETSREMLVHRHGDTWDLIWDAARTWTVKNWRAKVGSLEASVTGRDAEIERLTALLAQVTETAKLRLAKIKAVETTAEDREKKILVQAGIIEQQRENIRTQTRTIQRQRDERISLTEELHTSEAQERELRLANLRIGNLSRRLNTAEAQLAEARALTTQGTTTVFEENERLVAELRRITSLLADAEEKILGLESLTKVQQFLRTPRALVPCTDTMGDHTCKALSYPDRNHVQRHHCHCGTVWS